MIRNTRKCLSLFIILSAIHISFVFEAMKSKKKHFIIWFVSITAIIFVFKHITQFDIKREEKEITFVDILHQLPIEERRYYVWKTAFKSLNNQSFGINTHSATNKQTIAHLINNTIERYKVRIFLYQIC